MFKMCIACAEKDAEIARLKKEFKKQFNIYRVLSDEAKRMEDEIARLTKRLGPDIGLCEQIDELESELDLEKHKIASVRELAIPLLKEIERDYEDYYDDFKSHSIAARIDNVLQLLGKTGKYECPTCKKVRDIVNDFRNEYHTFIDNPHHRPFGDLITRLEKLLGKTKDEEVNQQ